MLFRGLVRDIFLTEAEVRIAPSFPDKGDATSEVLVADQ